ncbi:MAG: universal stress protein [Verrucomicrobia bacterium]|jgi:nucleotide-binding universal stress UspA family protein|nr:universal stress protein [Verrucomicrobiota bacterium]
MKTRNTKRKLAETAVGMAVGGAVAGPIGAVAGAFVAGHVEEGLEHVAKLKPPQDWNKLAADDPLIHVWPKRILVPLDFSPPSRRALRFARHWADFFAAKVYLLHVVEPTTAVGEFGTVPLGAVQRDISGKAKAALGELARTEFPDSIPIRMVVRKGKAYDQIAATARSIRADLIIIATHGRTGLKHVVLGSTAERVARHAPCPVLVLRRSATR